jgi:site-specific DNA-methyltransferase (adenine-specific)
VDGDCRELLAELPESSIDAVITDPPYGLEFMGQEWDKLARRRHLPAMQSWHEQWAREALRVLKPGAHLLAFGGTRTYHRLASGIEDAGFEIRDQVAWLYGQGFPKSRNVGEGWGTALKPAHEPIVLARKPISEPNVMANRKRWGTGAINIDASRVPFADEADETEAKGEEPPRRLRLGPQENRVFGDDRRARRDSGNYDPPGRWPPNVALDTQAAATLDEEVGARAPGRRPGTRTPGTGYVGSPREPKARPCRFAEVPCRASSTAQRRAARSGTRDSTISS